MDPSDQLGAITVYLKRLSQGDTAAQDPLAEAVYAELQRMGRGMLQHRGSDCSLQATALVNGVLFELVRLRSIDWKDREHFFRVAARMLRRRLVDYIRSRRASKRPPGSARVDFEMLLLPTEDRFEEILQVHQGLDKLATVDASLAELVEMVYFSGVTITAAAAMRGVSEKTIDRHLDFARRWLKREFSACPSFSGQDASFDRV
jgi:RNA polymerase sigma factor (TIGR02999 family)